jgi:hypothetical protein
MAAAMKSPGQKGTGAESVWKEPRGSTHTFVIPPKHSKRVYVQNLRPAMHRKTTISGMSIIQRHSATNIFQVSMAAGTKR